MKVISIFRDQLELERIELDRRSFVVGRSPTNDVVLRAPGVSPIHFLIEWVGTGLFDSGREDWSVVSLSSQSTKEGEGFLLSQNPVVLDGFRFELREDKLATRRDIGGRISNRVAGDFSKLGSIGSSNDLLLEILQIRSDSKALEEVGHHVVKKLRGPASLLKNVPELKVASEGNQLKVHWGSMKQVIVANRGSKIEARDFCNVNPQDFIQIRWRAYEIYLRLVERQRVPAIPHAVIGDPLLKGIFLLSISVFAMFFYLVSRDIPNTVVTVRPPPPRLATIEIKELAPVPPIQEPVKIEEISKQPPLPTQLEVKKIGIENVKNSEKPAEAALAKFAKRSNAKASKIGLNNPAPITDSNTVGILGAFAKADKGKGVSAENILNQGVVTQSLSSNEKPSSLSVQNSPSGTMGEGSGGSPDGDIGNSLVGAQTSFEGGDSYNPGSAGPISRKNARGKGWQAGTGLSSGGTGLGAGSIDADSDFGALDANSFGVQGGLDAETVRRIINSYKAHVQTCYDRALVQAPGLSGRISLLWQISPSGSVASAKILSSTVSSGSLEACMLDLVRKMKFPKAQNGRPTTVKFPYVLQARD